MKKIATLILLLVSIKSYAIDLIGGEITWKYQGSSYVFTLKIYHECSPTSGVVTSTVKFIDVTGHPSITDIPAFFISSEEMSPISCGFSCAGNNTNGSTYKVYTFQSDPVNLGAFIPPPTGWVFSWENCCRKSLQNIAGSFNNNFAIRSIMYGYNTSASSPMHNSSPEFIANIPKLICAGSYLQVPFNAADSDGDSVYYTYDRCAMDYFQGVAVVNFLGPYTLADPLPGVDVLDPHSGILDWQTSASDTGDFAIVVRADEYRCGVKVSSVFREVQFRITMSCVPLLNGNANSSPLVQINASPGNIYTDTVSIGDSVSLLISIVDYDSNVVTMNPQQVQLDTYGDFGVNDTGLTGCSEPPCATLDVPNGSWFSSAHNYQFNWIADCNHILENSFSSECNDGIYLRQFLLRANDDNCPSAGISNAYIRLYVKIPYIKQSGDTLFCMNNTGLCQWYKNNVLISNATGNWYVPSGTGSYSATITTINGCSFSTNTVIDSVNCSFTPTVTGNVYLCLQQGTTLSTQNYMSYQWYSRTGTGARLPIVGENSQSIIIPAGNVGKFYSVEVSDSVCMEISPEVRLYNLPSMVIQLSSNLSSTGFSNQYYLCEGDTAQLSINPVFNTNVVWMNNGDTIVGANSNVLAIADSGHYLVSGASADCSQNILTSQYTITVILDPCISSIQNEERYARMLLSPNPAKTNFTIEINAAKEEMAELVIYSISGVPVYRDFKTIVSGTNIIPVGSIGLKQGAYIVSLKSYSVLARGRLVIN